MHVFPILIKACWVVQISLQSEGKLYLYTWQPLSVKQGSRNYCGMKHLCGIPVPEKKGIDNGTQQLTKERVSDTTQ